MEFTREDYIKIASDSVTQLFKDSLTSVFDASRSAYKKFSVSTEIAFDKYYDTAIKNYCNSKTLINRAEIYFLYDVYVDLSLSCGRKNIATDNISNLFRTGNAVILTGLGGSGKSTLLKHLFLNCIKSRGYVCFFIELRALNEIELDECFESALLKVLNDMNLKLDIEHFKYALEKCDVMLFLDGFDELTDDRVRKVSNGIKDLYSKYERLGIILTSRPCGDQFASWNNFIEMKVNPLDKTNAIKLIEKLDYIREIKERFLIDLENGLFESHITFASNPLLLTIMLLTFGEYAEIPSKMHLFYEEAFAVLFRKHDSNKGMPVREVKSKLAKDDFERSFSAFCFLSYIETVYDFRENQILEMLNRSKSLVGLNYNSDDYLIDLQKVVCMIQQEGLHYTFIHRSFQEYFTALFIINSSEENQKTIFDSLSPRTIKQDNVLNLLYDMKQNIVDLNLVIPTLRKIKEQTLYGVVSLSESIRLFLNHYCWEIKILYDQNGERFFSYTGPLSWPSEIIIEVMLFALKKHNLDTPLVKFAASELNSLIANAELKVERSLKPNLLFENDRLFDLHLEYGYVVNYLMNSMDLLNTLENQYANKRNSLFSALTSNNKS